MWTYSPQKRQVGSAFALTYRLLLRSCKLMGAFIIHPCLPFWWSLCTSVGPLRSTVVTPLLRYCWPIRHPLAFHRFPGFASYTASCSVDFSTGRGGLLQLLSASLSPCRRYHPARVSHRFSQLRRSMLPSPFKWGLGLWGYMFRGHRCVHFRCGPMTRSPSQRWLCRSALFVLFPPRIRSQLQGPDSCPGGPISH
jgi:hypothetical protein